MNAPTPAAAPSAARGLLDTNVVIGLGRLDPSVLPDEPVISAVTLAELSAGPLVADDDDVRAARQAHLQLAESSFEPLAVDAEVARAFGRVAADLRRAGRTRTARAFDALIAATAIAHGIPLYTANEADFRGIRGLDVRPVA